MTAPSFYTWPELRLLLLQLDLSGHTQTMRKLNAREAALLRARFAANLNLELEANEFRRCFWAGDGGLFWHTFDPPVPATADLVIDAADAAIETFAKFRSSEPKSEGLSLRVTASLETVICHTEEGNWYGVGFNQFLKYEREIAKYGQLVISGELREKLSTNVRDTRFPRTFEFLLKDGANAIVSVDTRHSKAPDPVTGRLFDAWLKEEESNLPRPSLAATGKSPKYSAVGNAIIVDTARSKGGYSSIDVKRASYSLEDFEKEINKTPYKEAWAKKLAAHKDDRGTKAAVLRLAHPTSDESRLLLDLGDVDYSVVRSFNELIEENENNIEQSLVEGAFAFEAAKGRTMPSTLTTENAVILDGPGPPHAGEKRLLLSHRSQSRGSFPNTWSVSFEEQYCPVGWPDPDGKRTHPPDENVAETVLRGLREEFLTSQYGGPITISQHAAYVQLDNFNLDILGIIKLPGCGFEKIRDLWRAAKPVDHTEHSALAVLPVDRDVLRKALQAKGPADLLTEFTGPDGDIGTQIRNHPWHPTSPARIAFCLWCLEEGAI
jgi:class 3 adenylate cyclase